MKNTLVNIFGKSTSKLDNLTVRTIQKDTRREKRVLEKWPEHWWVTGHIPTAWYMYNCSHRTWGWGERTEKKFEKILAKVFPNLVKTTKPGNPKNVKQ